MQEAILDVVNQYGYFGIFFLIMIENIFPPIPSEIILTFGGFITTHSTMSVWGVIAAATAGSVAGAIILYSVGRVLNADRLARLVGSRLGKMLHLKEQDVRKAERWFLKHGKKTVFFGRFVPIIRSLISLPAGCAKMRLRTFIPLTVLGTLIWNVALTFFGRFAGDAWVKVANYLDIYSMIALVVIAIIAVVIAVIFIKKRFLQDGGDE